MTDLPRQLLDRHEIQEVLTRYCEALDRLDRPLLASCFHPDSQHNHSFVGPSSEFLGFAWDVLSGCVATHHQLGNLAITLDGDFARSNCYFPAYPRLGNPAPAPFDLECSGMDLTIGGRYIDRFERRGGVWKIIHRTGVHDWQRYEAPAERGFFTTDPDGRGRRDLTDPAYTAP